MKIIIGNQTHVQHDKLIQFNALINDYFLVNGIYFLNLFSSFRKLWKNGQNFDNSESRPRETSRMILAYKVK
jgi:hypothetical protein